MKKKNVCMPLVNVQGTHVEKYRHFRTMDISRKGFRMIPQPDGGTILEHVPDNEQSLPSLADSVLTALCSFGMKLEEYFGGPQDIEWAMDDAERLYILQSRQLHMPVSPDDSERVPLDLSKYDTLISGGRTASSGIAVGRVFNAFDIDSLTDLAGDEILVARTASPDYAGVIGKVREYYLRKF